jgi:predicted tellurium resistance membrane protein TerC
MGLDALMMPSPGKVIKTARYFVPVTSQYSGSDFFTRNEGDVLKATPLLLVLVCIELSDVVFAVDSVPVSHHSASFSFSSLRPRLLLIVSS